MPEQKPKPVLYTVGHSNYDFDRFLALLKKNDIKAIADVRSNPYSKYTPQFNREHLERELKNHGIFYVFLGNELGARRKEPECYKNKKVVYSQVAKTPAFQRGIDRLKNGASRMRVAIMCAEKDPLTCHRTILVAHFARKEFKEIKHILEDGSIETGDQADKRLLRESGLDADDLFNPPKERLTQAYRKRAEKIAYQEEKQKEGHVLTTTVFAMTLR